MATIGYGFNKDKRLAAEAADLRTSKYAPGLDPEFPFTVISPPQDFLRSNAPLGGYIQSSYLTAGSGVLNQGW